jgi:Thiamine pyrophosphate-requiring enzymes [acetolactate synthase, pyruvate dehydrogenase (cytochrome), glyoxylate carboligase, phosphonopyruvate decarboxylase]
MNASAVMIETLLDWGVDTVFGLPGDGINGIMEALRSRQDGCGGSGPRSRYFLGPSF